MPGKVSRSSRYPLSPLQHGMLFHTLSNETEGTDVEQIVCSVREPLDVEALRCAWEHVVARHDALRTRFDWLTDRPVQIVEPAVALDFAHESWGDGVPDHNDRLDAFLDEDRRRGFDLAAASPMRVRVIAVGDAWLCLWSFHHIILDGRSFPVILSEVFEHYAAVRDGCATPQHSPPTPYGEFVRWLGDQDATAGESFWRQNLAGFAAPTPLPLGGLGGSSERLAVDVIERRMPRAATDALRAFAAAHGVTLNTVVQGAWALLLHHYTGEEDVVFGATRACRGSVDTDVAGAVGLLINTLPVRAPVRSEDRLVGWLQRLRALHVALRDHEHTPLTTVQAWSEVPSGKPLFETLVVFENHTLNTTLRSLGGAWSERQVSYRGQTNYPLALIAYGDDELALRLEYATPLFEAEGASQIADHVSTLLESIPTHADSLAAAVPYMTKRETATLTAARARPTTVRECIHERFEQQARRRPDAVAAVDTRDSITYRELAARADHLANRLRGIGVGRDVPVGLCFERSLEMAVAILGVLKAGGAYVPIDPAYPAGRIDYIARDAGVAALVTHDGLADRLPSIDGPVITIDGPVITIDDPDAADRGTWSPPSPDSLAYVMYTSGSTGRPKGVAVTHANVVRLFDATREPFDFGAEDVWTLFHSYGFDFSVWEIWGALAHGGRLVVVPHAVSRSPDAFWQLVREQGVTVLNQTPSAFRQLMHYAVRPERERELDATATSLRWVIFGGEALEPATLAPWFDRFGDQRPRLANMYGITETTVHVTLRPLTAADACRVGSFIGKPLDDLELLVLDRHLRPTPIGVGGEVYVGGAGLARGYWNRPDLTAERFVEHPFDTRTDARLYRTGDLARRLPDGDLEYLGRCDDQLKVRGFRIEPGEVEAALTRFPAIGPAAVLARPDEAGNTRLVAYYVAGDAAPTPTQLRRGLAEALPEHMVPTAFVPVAALPLTPNGKLDRAALPAPDAERPSSGVEYSAPTTPLQRTIAGAWSKVLGLTRIGARDNFYDLGGDSLKVVAVAGLLEQELGHRIDVVRLLEYPTVETLADHLGGTGADDSVAQQDVVARAARRRAALRRATTD